MQSVEIEPRLSFFLSFHKCLVVYTTDAQNSFAFVFPSPEKYVRRINTKMVLCYIWHKDDIWVNG